MGTFTIIVIVVVLLSIASLWMAIRILLIKKRAQIDKAITDLFNATQNKSAFIKAKNTVQDQNGPRWDNLKAILEDSFFDHIITKAEENSFSESFRPIYRKAYSFAKKLTIFHLALSDGLQEFIDDYCSLPKLVKEHNEHTIKQRLLLNKDFFDTCLKYPLDQQQRRSIVSEEENCLVISSAGCGKTSSIIGKVKYLTDIQKVPPQDILLISYTNKAAAELTERLNLPELRGYTFHKLALDIISKSTGSKPTICENTDSLIVNIFHQSLRNNKFKESIIQYFAEYQQIENDCERREREQRDQLSRIKKDKLKAMLPDMDGNAIYVRSKQEQTLCFLLSSLGLNFRYEEPYEHVVADEMHSQYRPDFSIHYTKNGVNYRAYLEHFGVDEHGFVPSWFAREKGISYEEANRRYGDGITWKKATHEKFGTTLFTTSSADFHYNIIRKQLIQFCTLHDIPFHEKTKDELCELLLPKDSPQEKTFIRLITTFITLLKSSCTSIDEVLKKAKSDNNSTFTIKHIFKPILDLYTQELQRRKEIDFTDVILKATHICKTSHPVKYSHIIVDEFQDISLDRYYFLLALRDGNPPAKLYCVGDDWQSIYRFSGSDMSLFSHFEDYFGPTEINKIETTYRFGNPLIDVSSQFIQRNETQNKKTVRPCNDQVRTDIQFYSYSQNNYCSILSQLISSIPEDKSVFLLGRYSFDDIHLSSSFQSKKEGNKYFYIINNRKIEFLTVHKSKGLEADFVILLQCNKGTYGFPSQISDNPVLDYVLTKSDQFPFGEERRLFYVAITRAKIKTIVLYDNRYPSPFVDEILFPDTFNNKDYSIHPNAMKKWTKASDNFLITLYQEGKSIKTISEKMGRSQTAIVMRLSKLGII